MVSEKDMKKAVMFYKKAKGTVQQINAFLMEKKGFTFTECLEAMNTATENALLKSAGVWD